MRTAVGITCGIGSMLIGAKQAGFDVVGNIEWRKYYHKKDEDGRNTFSANFPEAIFEQKLDKLFEEQFQRLKGCDVAFGHPECGAYSTLNGSNAKRGKFEERKMDAGDIPLFTHIVGQLKPRFFAMDDLPKSLPAYPMQKYAEALPDYDLFPEWVSNYGYGNIQKHRNRMFMIGALKTERFAFQAAEVEHGYTIADIIGDLPEDPVALGNFPNHDPHTLTEVSGRGLHMKGKGLWYRPTWAEMREWAQNARPGQAFEYHSTAEGNPIKSKPGWAKGRWDGPSAVLTGVNAAFHPIRCLPLTIRERARIQGFPDDFVFYGTKLDEKGEWNHEKNLDIVKQTGKAMPIQFNRHFARQVMNHLEGRPWDLPSSRILKPNELVDDAKKWYCREVGYSNQEAACGQCWLYSRCTLDRRVGGPYVAPASSAPAAVERAPKEPRVATPRPQKTPRPEPAPRPQPVFKGRMSNL